MQQHRPAGSLVLSWRAGWSSARSEDGRAGLGWLESLPLYSDYQLRRRQIFWWMSKAVSQLFGMETRSISRQQGAARSSRKLGRATLAARKSWRFQMRLPLLPCVTLLDA